MNTKLVSVIIPTFKRSETLSRAIDSVLNQTYTNIEIIVVDDNGDNSIYRKKTELVMSKYSTNKNIHYLKHKENKNGSAARNTGIKFSSGEYIAFLDDDDEFFCDKLSLQVSRMESLSSDFGGCYTNYQKQMENGSFQIGNENREGNMIVLALSRMLYIYAGSNLLVRKEVVDELGGFDESFSRNQDLEFLVRFFNKYKLAYVDGILLQMNYDKRTVHLTYEDTVKIEKQFLQTFKTNIEELSADDRAKVYKVIALERFKSSLQQRKITDSLSNLKENNVTILDTIKFISYLCNRVITKKCYGFSL